MILALKKVLSYRKLGTEPLLSTAFVLLYSISSDHGAMQPSHISPMEALLCDVDKDDATDMKRFVHSQPLLWHLDKDLQKCGRRLVEAYGERVIVTFSVRFL